MEAQDDDRKYLMIQCQILLALEKVIPKSKVQEFEIWWCEHQAGHLRETFIKIQELNGDSSKIQH